jgi:hypothetical protein
LENNQEDINFIQDGNRFNQNKIDHTQDKIDHTQDETGFTQGGINYIQDKHLKDQTSKNIFERWFGGGKVSRIEIDSPLSESITKEVYDKEKLAQQEFEKISKFLVEEVKPNLSLEEFLYNLIKFTSEKDKDVRKRIIEKFGQNIEFIDMIISKEKPNTSSDKTRDTTLTELRPILGTNQYIPSPSSTNFSPFTPTTYEELNKEIEKNEMQLSRLNTVREEEDSLKEKLLDERRYLLDQKAKHLKSLLNIAVDRPINGVDVDRLQKDINS